MRNGLPFATAIAMCLGVSSTACGSDDENDSGPHHGTCDLRSVDFHCIERKGTAPAIADQKDACLEAGGGWSSEPCPATAELIGCCEYVYGDEFRECFYEGTTRDAEAYCADPRFEGTGVWTPAS